MESAQQGRFSTVIPGPNRLRISLKGKPRSLAEAGKSVNGRKCAITVVQTNGEMAKARDDENLKSKKRSRGHPMMVGKQRESRNRSGSNRDLI